MLFNRKSLQTHIIEQEVSFIESIPLDVKSLPDTQKLSQKQRLLLDLGFDNCRELKIYREEEKRIKKETQDLIETMKSEDRLKEAFKLLLLGRKYFGPETIFLPFGDFYNLMKKFNLVCGSFDCYHGDIPTDKLLEINNLVNNIVPVYSNLPEYHICNKIEVLSNIDIIELDEHAKLPDIIYRFPFIILGQRDVDILGTGVRTYTSLYRYTIKQFSSTFIRFFICAPEKEMDTLKGKVRFRKKIEDPMICSYTKYGVFICTRWGEESKSDIINQYEQLNTLIDKRAKELGIDL